MCVLGPAHAVTELTEEDIMKRVVLLPLLLVFAGCVTYDGVDQDGRHTTSRTLIECRQSGASACRMLPDVTYMRLPK